jgi:hypothetical protein
MTDDTAWYSPDRKPPARKAQTVLREVLWTTIVDGVEWSCEFRFQGESYVWDARLVRAGEFFASQRFVMRANAECWSTEQKQQIERGWVDWHPLHGQTILVRRSVRQGREVWLCDPGERTAAVPVWMTDRVACAALSIGPALVAVEALAELASLVNAAGSTHDRIAQPSQEEPDATSTTETNADPVRARDTRGRVAGPDRPGLGQGVGRSAARQRGGRRPR